MNHEHKIAMALAESEQRFRQMFERNRSVKLILNPANGRIEDANLAACDFYGYSREQLLQLSISDINVLSPEEIQVEMAQAQMEKRLYFNFRHRLAGGEVRDVEVYSGPLDTATGPRLYSIVHDVTQRRQVETELRMFQLFSQQGTDAHILLDEHARIRYVNTSACESLGYSEAELLQLSVPDIDPAFDKAAVLAHFDACKSGPMPPFETMHRRKDGSLFPVEVTSTAVCFDGEWRAFTACRDITARKDAESRLRLAASVFNGSPEGILITDSQARIVEVNDAFVELTGYTREQALGHSPSLLSSGRHGKAFYEAMWHSLLHRGRWSGELWNRRADGSLIAAMLRIAAVYSDDGALTHYVAIFSDVTAAKRQQERLERLAHYDALTGLPNRMLALDRLAALMAGADRQRSRVAVCYLDLDGFKDVNDQFGHARGDALLVTVAEQLSKSVRSCDTVARLGGDEFLVLLGGVETIGVVDAVLARLLQSLEQAAAPDRQAQRVTASIGVALYPDHGATPDHLLRAADQAMYQAKRRGKNRACMAGRSSDQTPAQEALLEELQAALRSNELCLHYQPKVCARSRRVLGAEALVRWQHPQRGLLSPAAFLPAVAGTPLEVDLDLWVVRTAVDQLARWRAAGRTLGLSINVSAGTLTLPNLADTVANIVRQTPRFLDKHLSGIELEVVETAALDDLGVAGRAIEACAGHGISFALDDFGTGYSSLSYLQQLPVNTIKIDRRFVGNMLTNRGDLHIVRAVIGLAAGFGATTVAEGVETEDLARMLAELGCDQLQGYGIARPMAENAFDDWLNQYEPSPFGFVKAVTGASTPL